MKAFYTITLLVFSNVFMTFAWFRHLKLQEMKISANWPLYAVILFSTVFFKGEELISLSLLLFKLCPVLYTEVALCSISVYIISTFRSQMVSLTTSVSS